MVKQIVGDLIKLAKNGEFGVICHGCNVHNTMGSGIAKSLRDEWPEVYDVDNATTKGDVSKLGTITFTKNIPGLVVVNCYTQEKYGKNVQVYADYDAIEKAMVEVKKQFQGRKIGMPKIGAGLARGDWNVILPIIEKVFCDPEDDVTIVEWEQDVQNSNSSSQQSGIAGRLSVFNKPISSHTNTANDDDSNTSSTNGIVGVMTPVVPQTKKKFHGKRRCKVCNGFHAVKDMVNYLPGVWVDKENCNKTFTDKVVELNPDLLVPESSN